MFFREMMKKVKKIFILPPVPTLLIAVPSFIFVTWVLINENVNPVISYTSYLVSAYAMIITVTGIVGVVKWIRAGISAHPLVKKLLNISWINRYLKETMFRAEISLYPGLMINLFYVGIKLFSGICYRSVWFGTLAVYYILLAVMRFSLLHHVRTKGIGKEQKIDELKKSRLCGIILMVLNWALVGIVILVVRKNSGFTYPGTLIYAMVLYTFYAVITAFMNVMKFRKYGSPVMSAAKIINLTAALVSMLSLETAMLTQFGTAHEETFRQWMIAITGTGVCASVLGMAVYMIVQTTIKIRKCEGGTIE
ncbi:MAG: hypothetical protein ACI4S2_05400 [Lachnospiraceae bacterium]